MPEDLVSRDMAAEMLAELERIAKDRAPSRGAPASVAAASRVLDHYRWQADREQTPERSFVMLAGGGSWQAAAQWLLANLERIKALAGVQVPALEVSQGQSVTISGTCQVANLDDVDQR